MATWYANFKPELRARVEAILAARKAELALYSHWTYIVRFQNDRIKIGVTANPVKRASYYRQETVRHDLGFGWITAYGALSREEALATERMICRAYASAAVPGHREWFTEDRVDSYMIERILSDKQIQCWRERPRRTEPGRIHFWAHWPILDEDVGADADVALADGAAA